LVSQGFPSEWAPATGIAIRCACHAGRLPDICYFAALEQIAQVSAVLPFSWVESNRAVEERSAGRPLVGAPPQAG
jgi:hypothetical protein